MLVGQEVAWCTGYGKPDLADRSIRVRVVSGPFKESWTYEGGGVRVKKMEEGSGSLWLVKRLDPKDGPLEEVYVESKALTGAWADHEKAAEEERQRRMKIQEKRDALAAKADALEARVKALGVKCHARPTGYGTVDVSITAEELEAVLDRLEAAEEYAGAPGGKRP